MTLNYRRAELRGWLCRTTVYTALLPQPDTAELCRGRINRVQRIYAMAARLLRIGVRTIEWEKKHVKKFLMSILAITAIYCMSSLPAFSQKSTRQTQSSNAGNTDNSFLQKAIEANAAEVELGKMAESKSQ